MPKNYIVEDTKPKNTLVLNTKPKNMKVDGETFQYTETRNIRVGEPMGLLLTLTYPNTFSFTAPRS